MTVKDIIREAQHLSVQERQELVRALQEMTVSQQRRKHSLLDLVGLGAEIWKDVDAQTYIRQQRDDWDDAQ
jgi:hypothetical protein